ncbi:hypothetical protein XELAEV_18005604mg [Xenopus laevis]|uniref:Uncharacterized protein n=1 Tax=Xenopus laevis TaxID=8355 RepID=A0A974DYY2_XENLA|nr:hypothetical protein XELAEV_18005604mg [Xenopus laevis]
MIRWRKAVKGPRVPSHMVEKGFVLCIPANVSDIYIQLSRSQSNPIFKPHSLPTSSTEETSESKSFCNFLAFHQ